MSCGTATGVQAHKARNEPPCPGCRKFMTNPAPVKATIQAPHVGPRPRRTPDRLVKARRVIECGTVPGYRRHKRRKEESCQPCRGAMRADQKLRESARKEPNAPKPPRRPRSPSSKPLSPCGTPAARQRHILNGEKPCDPCRVAYNEQSRVNYRKRKGIVTEPFVCGTARAYEHHRHQGEPACQPCLDAKAEHSRSQYVRKTEPLPPAECGTTRGYRKHITDKTPTCKPCRDAYNTRRNATRAKKKDRPQ